MATKRSRRELMQAIRSGFQQTSGQSVLLSQIIADNVGLSPSDLECMGFLEDGGPMTAGRLAELTGLTSGAVTRMIDRLERARYVRRRSDPDDRRKVLVELVPGRAKEFDRFYGPMARGATEFLARYSDAELALIAELLDHMLAFGRAQTQRIQALPDKPKRKLIKLKAKIPVQRGQNVRIRL
ncbi:MAG TPA: MarR family transcriptional regulator [Candidatus Limnocylindria bacterium]|nr:MarR family transcriptional regulator [Candidatus Limnocylindria bacterium]